MKIVIVGFKVAEDNSTIYRKLDIVDWYDQKSIDKLNKTLLQAIDKSDFISIRIVR